MNMKFEALTAVSVTIMILLFGAVWIDGWLPNSMASHTRKTLLRYVCMFYGM